MKSDDTMLGERRIEVTDTSEEIIEESPFKRFDILLVSIIFIIIMISLIIAYYLPKLNL